jgi:hypothetical protein
VLHLAASSIDEEVALRTCAYFIQRGALVDVSNRRGETPLAIATTLGHQALQLFLSRHSERFHTEVRVGWGYYNFEMDELMSIDAYQRVVEFLGTHVQRLYPCPSVRTARHSHAPLHTHTVKVLMLVAWRSRGWWMVGANRAAASGCTSTCRGTPSSSCATRARSSATVRSTAGRWASSAGATSRPPPLPRQCRPAR